MGETAPTLLPRKARVKPAYRANRANRATQNVTEGDNVAPFKM
jgi:hypothetical protein